MSDLYKVNILFVRNELKVFFILEPKLYNLYENNFLFPYNYFIIRV